MSCAATVSFTAHEEVGYGDKLCVVGNHKALGRWDLKKAFELRWNKGDVWKGGLELPDNESVEYKLVKVKGIGDPIWESGGNRKLHVNGDPIVVRLVWNVEDRTVVKGVEDAEVAEAKDKRSGGSPQGAAACRGAAGDAASVQDSSASGTSSSSRSEEEEEEEVEVVLDPSPQNAWQGKATQFMQLNEHSKERRGIWNTEGLQGTSLLIVQGDEKAGRYALHCAPGLSQLLQVWHTGKHEISRECHCSFSRKVTIFISQ